MLGATHTLTEGRNTEPAGAYTKTCCRAVIEGYQNMSSSIWAPPGTHNAANQTWEALAAEEAAGADEDVQDPKLTSIDFPAHVAHVPAHLAKALRRVHQNLSHLANHDLLIFWCQQSCNQSCTQPALQHLRTFGQSW